MIVSGPNDTEVTQGHNAILNCAAHGYPAAKFVWLFGMQKSTKLNGSPRMVVLPGGSLLIQNVRMSDAGVYRCIASNNAGTDSAKAVLKVGGKEITYLFILFLIFIIIKTAESFLAMKSYFDSKFC